VESNNFTIDPELISTLPISDPLFVAETNPALARLERGFVFRATQNVQALGNSTTPPGPERRKRQ
jgi:hypothetical protein